MIAIGFALLVAAFVVMVLVPVSMPAPRWKVWVICFPVVTAYCVGTALLIVGITRWLWEVAP